MHKDTKMQPIFVFGRHRSGTTWVTNVLMSHKKVFSPNHETHNGQHESAFFAHWFHILMIVIVMKI